MRTHTPPHSHGPAAEPPSSEAWRPGRRVGAGQTAVAEVLRHHPVLIGRDPNGGPCWSGRHVTTRCASESRPKCGQVSTKSSGCSCNRGGGLPGAARCRRDGNAPNASAVAPAAADEAGKEAQSALTRSTTSASCSR
eukprot:scaffold20339_cov120-Isochrysis_galbana.AAC.8